MARYQRPSQLPNPVSMVPCTRSIPIAMSSVAETARDTKNGARTSRHEDVDRSVPMRETARARASVGTDAGRTTRRTHNSTRSRNVRATLAGLKNVERPLVRG